MVFFNTDIVTFTIDDVEYQGEAAMTWEEWCNSEYNTIDLMCDELSVGTPDMSGDTIELYLVWGGLNEFGEYSNDASPTDLITASSEYYLY